MPEARGTMPTVAILAGGVASRMRPRTLTTPKSLLPVAGEPFLAHQLRFLVSQGIDEVVLCCGHLEEQIRAFAAGGADWGCRLSYASDGPALLGTGGALRQALPLLGSDFLVLYGDSYLPTDYAQIWRRFEESGKQGLMTVYANDGQWDTSNVEFEDGRIIAYSKQARTPGMRHIDYGLSCFRAEAFEPWPSGAHFDLVEVMQRLQGADQLAGYAVAERFYEIGSPGGYAETEALLAGHSYVPAAGERA